MTNLKKLIPFLGDIFENFYQDMLSHEQMSVFFKGEDAIRHLIEKQKQSFVDSLDDDPGQLESRYRRLGALHYDLRVPSTDFLRSTAIWKRSFTQHAINEISEPSLVYEIDDYFRNVDNYMSHGYLNRQLEFDLDDLDKLITRYRQQFEEADDTLDHLNWLKQMLIAVKYKDVSLAPDLDAETCQVHNILKDPPESTLEVFDRAHFADLHERLHIDSKSLFYFIEKSDFPEVLSLYANLLSVYKITLITLGNLSLQERVYRLSDQIQAKVESEKIYKATVSGSQHILNNLLNQLLFVKRRIHEHPELAQDISEKFEDMTSDAQALLSKLSSVDEVNPESIRDAIHPSKNK